MEFIAIIGISLIVGLTYKVYQLNKLVYKLKERSEPELPGYSKFLEDSREAAFDYIQEVQDAIRDYKDKTELKKKPAIKESYAKLISMLPEEEA